MNTLDRREGVYYTQNIENLPIENRVFFREGKGVNATNNNFRAATEEELEAWKEYQRRQEEEMKKFLNGNYEPTE